jgi:hypothetical protein
MDLAVYLNVLWRHRLLIAAGLAVAFVLAFLSFARVDLNGVTPEVSHRQQEVWRSASTLFVTQEGFPWGRSILDDVIKVGGKDGLPPAYIPRYGDPGRYSGLAQLYAALARSDEVQRAVLRNSPPGARFTTDVAKSADNSTVLPLIYMTGYGNSPQSAQAIADRAARTFRAYLAKQQTANGIPPSRRVQVTQLSGASEPELFEARSLVRPAFVFLLIVTIFVALAFVAENAGFTRPSPAGRMRRVLDGLGGDGRGAQQLATSMSTGEQTATGPRPAEARSIAGAQRAESPRGAEPRPLREQPQAKPSQADEEPPEEPPARVQRWA